MTEDAAIVAVLNELLAAEQSSLLFRLLNSGVFVGPPSRRDYVRIEEMARENQVHCALLAETIDRLGGTPVLPSAADIRIGSLHYQELRSLMPRLREDHQKVVRLYESAVDRMSNGSTAHDLVRKLLADHLRHAEMPGDDTQSTPDTPGT